MPKVTQLVSRSIGIKTQHLTWHLNPVPTAVLERAVRGTKMPPPLLLDVKSG